MFNFLEFLLYFKFDGGNVSLEGYFYVMEWNDIVYFVCDNLILDF